MKKIIFFVLLLCMVLSLAACANNESTVPESTVPDSTVPEISMQDICDANRPEAWLENHRSVFVQGKMDGEVWVETYLTKEYTYVHFPDEEMEVAQYMTDNGSYAFSGGDYLCHYLYIAPEGVTNDFARDRAQLGVFFITEEIVEETIESVNEKDGRITVTSELGKEFLAEESGLISYKNEYVLDAKTHELISVNTDYTDEEGTVLFTTEYSYDTEEPEGLAAIMKYENQTEDLRNVTIVSNPGTEKEVSQSFRIPKGLIVGFTWDEAFENKVEFCNDAAGTEAYDPYANTDSDLTVYVKWAE